MAPRPDPEQILDTDLNALSTESDWKSVLDERAVPVYTTDTQGSVTYWNLACVRFAGREPVLGQDRWCVTWQLFTMDGDPLSHADCPMAQAIRERRPVRDAIAIAERPDRSRVAFRPFPTPLFDSHGNFTGAVNVLIDVSDQEADALHEQADRCRRLAHATYDREVSKVLGDMAEGFDNIAEGLSGKRD